MSPETVVLTIELPVHTAQALADFAAGVGMHPAQWLAAQARAVTLSGPDKDVLVQHWSRGLTDAEIARRMDLTNQQVAMRRRAKNLPANKKQRDALDWRKTA